MELPVGQLYIFTHAATDFTDSDHEIMDDTTVADFQLS
jgi:hypothetical protein